MKIGRIANLTSIVLHPLIIVPTTLFIVGFVSTDSIYTSLLSTSLFVIISLVPSFLFVANGVRKGRFTDFDVSDQRQRNSIYFFGLLSIVFAIVVMYFSQTPLAIILSVCTILLGSIIMALVNHFITKASGHVFTIVQCSILILWVLPQLQVLILCVVSAICLGWSRVQLKRHTIEQVILGGALGASGAFIFVTTNIFT